MTNDTTHLEARIEALERRLKPLEREANMRDAGLSDHEIRAYKALSPMDKDFRL